MAASGPNRSSILVVEELFEREEPSFVDVLRTCYDAGPLQSFADRWRRDPRPWARAQILEYLRRPLNVPGHQPVVKRLFKQAEAAGDHELMAAFLTAFDCLVRRVRKKRIRYEWIRATNQVITHEEERLVLPRNTVARPLDARNPRTGEKILIPGQTFLIERRRLYSYHTRHYLRRRAWRYFRKLTFQAPAQYVPAICFALRRYTDDDLRHPENLLDSWGLMQACFGRHEALVFEAKGCDLRPGRAMSELSAAPRRPELWQTEGAYAELFTLLTTAPARTVRVWARQMLEQYHAARLAALAPDEILRLFDADDAELQQLGAVLLGRIEGVARWPLDLWLRLLEVNNPAALAGICAQMEKHVSASRLDLAQCLRLASSAAVPVARLGLRFLQEKKPATLEERSALRTLGDARCEAVGGELVSWAWPYVVGADHYERDVVTALVDSLNSAVREAAWTHLSSARATLDDPVLWSRMLETPFDDLRFHLLNHLESRRFLPGPGLPGAGGDQLAPVWTAVLLGVHRGGRSKPAAVRQLCAAIERRPETAARLLPVLRAACRSVRHPERRAALAAAAALAARMPELESLVSRELPELALAPLLDAADASSSRTGPGGAA